MICNMILCGVGGQGVLSLAAIIAKASLSAHLNVRQSEVHGMSQRGGEVSSHLRIGDEEIAGDLVPSGTADLIISMEPMESLRYLNYLKPNGIVPGSGVSGRSRRFPAGVEHGAHRSRLLVSAAGLRRTAKRDSGNLRRKRRKHRRNQSESV